MMDSSSVPKVNSSTAAMVGTTAPGHSPALANSVPINIEHHIEELFSYANDNNDNNDDDDDDDDIGTSSEPYYSQIKPFTDKNLCTKANINIVCDNANVVSTNVFHRQQRQTDVYVEHHDDEDDNNTHDHDHHHHDDDDDDGDIEDCSDSKSSSARSACSLLVPFEFRAILADSPDRGVAMISNFGSMKTLYETISREFDINPHDILYCTLNTPLPDMGRVLGGQIGLDDIIFVHRSSEQRKEVEMRKTDCSLGLTIADNGNGRAFIKHIRPDSTASRVPFIQAGDHIEAIQGKSYVGSQHSVVASALRAIEPETVFMITLIEPKRAQFRVPKRTPEQSELDVGGRTAECEELARRKALNRIGAQLEHFIGVSDCQLAQELYDAANDRSPKQFAAAIATGSLGDFCFPAHVLAIVWNSVNFPP